MFNIALAIFIVNYFITSFKEIFSVTFPQGYSQKTKIFSRCYLGKKYVLRSGAASCNTAHLIQSTKRLRGRIGVNIRPSRQSPINFWNKLLSPSKNNASTNNRQRSFSL